MEERRDEKIELTEIPNKIQKIQEQAKGLLDVTKKHSFLDPAVIGNLFFDNEMRKIVGSDGKTEEVPWTMDGILEERAKAKREGLISTKSDLATDIIVVINSQESFFSTIEHPLKNDSANNSDFLLALLERVLSSREDISDPYPVGGGESVSEEYWNAELLEVIRRTVLKPTTIILEGYGRNGINSVPGYEDEEFWGERAGLITAEMANEPDKDKYHELEKERQKRTIENRGEDEWVKILNKESVYLYGYLQLCIARKLESLRRSEEFARKFTFQGRRIATDEDLTTHKEALDKVLGLKLEFGKLDNFQQVLPWVKKNFGEGTDFQTLLQFLNPIELTLRK